MIKEFLTHYDYGTGAIWTYIHASSANEISKRYPKLTVLNEEPDWFTEDGRQSTMIVDIDELPDTFLKEME